jgi:integrase
VRVVTLIKGANGTWRGLFRQKGMKALHLSMRTEKKSVAKERHDAVHRLVREHRDALIDQLRSGQASVERVAAMVAQQEPLQAIERPPAAVVTIAEAPSAWDTVDAAAKRYLAWMAGNPNIEPGTERNAGFQLARFRDFVYDGARLGDASLDRVPSAAVQLYQRTMVDAETSPNTITVYMGRVATLWSWSIEHEQRAAREARRPARDLYSPVVPELLYRQKRPRERMLTVQEADRVLAGTPPQLLWFVGCGLLAGLRAGETLHLRPGVDVDLDIGTITIREQAGWKPKTARSRRLVPMAPSLLEIARVHTARYANDSWMMPSPVNPALPITDLGVRTHFIPIVERAGLIYGRDDVQGVTYHTLRHTFASHAVMRGVDLYTVAKLLGNTVKMVEDVYADLSPDFKRAAVAKLAGAFTLPDLLKSDTTSVTGEADL